MKRLSYQTLRESGYNGYLLENAPERVLQFGEGNFLRGFVDDFIDVMNERAGFQSKVAVVRPTGGRPGGRDWSKIFSEQDGLYTLYLRGFENGEKVSQKRVISCISRCLNPQSEWETVLACAENPDLRFITSNTTEAGIVYDASCGPDDAPPSSFPAKLTQLLYRRFQKSGGETGKGFVILACELIDDNGRELKRCVLRHAEQWGLGARFTEWVEQENLFCSTLVDRIVTGYPRGEAEALNQENGYTDQLLDTGEVFASWVIEGPQELKAELPFERAGLPIMIVGDHKPYKQRKVRILNGAHTAMVLGAYLAGQEIVRECMEDDVIRGFMNRAVYEEIIPTLTLPEAELRDFARSVTERFRNPFIDHALLAISLNSTSKWRARVLPSLQGYVEKKGELPPCLTASLAFYLAFYRGRRLEDQGLIGERNGTAYTIQDDRAVLEFYYNHRNDGNAGLVHAALSNEDFWGLDLSRIAGLEQAVVEYLDRIDREGAYSVMEHLKR